MANKTPAFQKLLVKTLKNFIHGARHRELAVELFKGVSLSGDNNAPLTISYENGGVYLYNYKEDNRGKAKINSSKLHCFNVEDVSSFTPEYVDCGYIEIKRISIETLTDRGYHDYQFMTFG